MRILKKDQGIFERFTQVDPAAGQGTGLGLAISAHLVAAMGGAITLDSKPGRGSTFAFCVPLPATAPVVDAEPVGRASRPLRVLVVEDNIVNQRVIEGMLRLDGHEVHLEADGRAGVAAAMSGAWDVVFMDVRMPVMDGLAATKVLRSRGFDRPIVALTANAMASDRAETDAAGMDAHLCKPVQREVVRRLLVEVAEGRLGHLALVS